MINFLIGSYFGTFCSLVFRLYAKIAIAEPTTKATAIVVTIPMSKPVVCASAVCGLGVGSNMVLFVGAAVGVGVGFWVVGLVVGVGGLYVGVGGTDLPLKSESKLLAMLPSIDIEAGARTMLLLMVIDSIWAIQDAPL